MNDCLPLSCRQNAHQTVRLCVAHVQQNGTSSTNIFPTREDIVPLRCFTGRKREDTLGDGCQSGPPLSKHEHEIAMFSTPSYDWVWDGGMVGWSKLEALAVKTKKLLVILYVHSIPSSIHGSKKCSIGIDPSSRP